MKDKLDSRVIPEPMRREFDRLRAEIAAKGISLDELPGCSENHKLYVYLLQSGLVWLTECEADAALRGDAGKAAEARNERPELRAMLDEHLRSCAVCFAEIAAKRGDVQ